ncbi:hypothetical protein TA3x_000926 [Tundrisphaera sp. TA3]|uniref:hypothetical protein n=1 Tax=Tundrisphaera sp. TA3 TaxID=3435775 RepID=UPI003EBFBC91
MMERAERFYVKAASVNAVRRAVLGTPGGVRVIGRYDRETIECRHTMAAQSLAKNWPVLLSRFKKAGLSVVDRPGAVNSGPESAE